MLLYLYCVRSEFYFLRLFGTDKFVGKGTTGKIEPSLGPFSQAAIFGVERSKRWYEKKTISVGMTRGKLLSIEVNSNRLKIAESNWGNKQVFRLIPVNMEGVFNIANSAKCITFIQDKNTFMLTKCLKDNKNQQFEFLNTKKYSAFITQGSNRNGQCVGGLDIVPLPQSNFSLSPYTPLDVRESMRYMLGVILDIVKKNQELPYITGSNLMTKKNLFGRLSDVSLLNSHGTTETLSNVAILCAHFF